LTSFIFAIYFTYNRMVRCSDRGADHGQTLFASLGSNAAQGRNL
jgi:hypothetical protein